MRIKDFNKLEARLIKKLYEKVKNNCRDGVWREWRGKFRIGDRDYGFECVFRLDDLFLSFRQKTVTDGNDRIIIPPSVKLN